MPWAHVHRSSSKQRRMPAGLWISSTINSPAAGACASSTWSTMSRANGWWRSRTLRYRVAVSRRTDGTYRATGQTRHDCLRQRVLFAVDLEQREGRFQRYLNHAAAARATAGPAWTAMLAAAEAEVMERGTSRNGMRPHWLYDGDAADPMKKRQSFHFRHSPATFNEHNGFIGQRRFIAWRLASRGNQICWRCSRQPISRSKSGIDCRLIQHHRFQMDNLHRSFHDLRNFDLLVRSSIPFKAAVLELLSRRLDSRPGVRAHRCDRSAIGASIKFRSKVLRTYNVEHCGPASQPTSFVRQGGGVAQLCGAFGCALKSEARELASPALVCRDETNGGP